jgi:hypothetical protein
MEQRTVVAAEVEEVQRDASLAQDLDDLQRVEGRAEQAVELRRDDDVALPQPGEQRSADGALGGRDRARDAFLGEKLGNLPAMHLRIAVDCVALHVEASASAS